MTFRLVALLAFAIASTAPAQAQSVEEFYRGKRIEIRVGTGPGGGYDLAARLLARYIGKYIPGNPTAIVQNVPGAASLALMNQLYNTAPTDGTVLGVVTNGVPTAPLLTPEAVRFDLTRFQWIGSPAPETQIVMVWSKARTQTLADLFTTETIAGAIGPGTATYDVPMVTNPILGTRFKIVSGYANTAQIDLAMERGEVEGHAALGWVSAKTRNQKWIEEGKVKILAQYGFRAHPDLPQVPLFAMPKDEDERQAITVMFIRQEFGRPFLVPPNVPAARLAALRRAFDASMRDPGFIADARKGGHGGQSGGGRGARQAVGPSQRHAARGGEAFARRSCGSVNHAHLHRLTSAHSRARGNPDFCLTGSPLSRGRAEPVPEPDPIPSVVIRHARTCGRASSVAHTH